MKSINIALFHIFDQRPLKLITTLIDSIMNSHLIISHLPTDNKKNENNNNPPWKQAYRPDVYKRSETIKLTISFIV